MSFLNRAVSNNRHTKTIVVVFLLVLWNISTWFITKSYYVSRINGAIEQEIKLAKEQAGDIADSITRNLNYLHGVSDLLSREKRIRRIVARFGAVAAPSSLSYKDRKKLWTDDPQLNKVSQYLYLAHIALQADLIYVANAAGDVIASSNYDSPGNAVGSNVAQRKYFLKNRAGQRGVQYAVGMTTNIPGIYFATPVMIGGKFLGTVVAKVDVPELSFLISQVNSFVTDSNGVIILAKDKGLTMYSLPGAAISSIPVGERLYVYKRSTFSTLQIEPWADKTYSSLLRIQNKDSPYVLTSKDIPEYSLKVYVDSDVPEFDPLTRFRVWFAVMLGMSGSVLILIGYGAIAYLTSVKRSKALLNEQKNKLESFLQASNDGIHILNADGHLIMANERFCRMLGYEYEEMMDKNVTEWEMTPLDEQATQRINKLLRMKGGTVYETRYRSKNGQTFDVEIGAVPVKVDGRALLYNSARDISVRKKLEEELNLATMIVKNSSEGMIVSDASNRIIAVNPAFTNITGYSFDEVKDKSPMMFSSGRHDDAFYEAMQDKLAATGHWQGEIWDRHKNGDIQAKLMTINIIRNGDGSVHRYVSLFSDITKKKKTEELVWWQANFDPLTELPNRRRFRDHLEQNAAMSDHRNLSLALLLIDLDQFKEVNDTLGHDIGDLLLKEAARRISACVRETDMVARLGGDEFIVVLSYLADSSYIEDCSRRIIQKLAEPFHLNSQVVYVTASIGITLYPADASDIDTLMKNADQAMYVAKSKGRNRYSYFTKSLQQAAQRRMKLIYELRNALAGDQFRIYFQPIMELPSRRICKAEALLRWEHPEMGMIGPLEFISLAEEIGLINDIGHWMFKEAARWAKHWMSLTAEDFQISVNMSPIQFMATNEMYSNWSAHLRDIGLPGRNIVVEITEGLLLNAEAGVIDKLLALREAGIQVAIDDFGTGYSALAYLKKFHIDYLKIDKSFVNNLVTNKNDMALSEAIIVLAHKLGLKVIAEGVELEKQCNMLAAAGCDYVQGYLFSRPIPADEFELLLKNGWDDQAIDAVSVIL